jgi:hypothetical protein
MVLEKIKIQETAPKFQTVITKGKIDNWLIRDNSYCVAWSPLGPRRGPSEDFLGTEKFRKITVLIEEGV